MKTTLNTYTVADVCHGFTYNELEGKGLFGLSGKLTLMYLSRYLRKPHTNYETDNSPYALFCRGLLYLYDIDLKSLLYNRSQKDFLTY